MTTQSRVWRRDIPPPRNEHKRQWLLSGSGRASAAGGVFRSLTMLALFNSLLLLLLLPPSKFGSSFVTPFSSYLLSAGRSRGPDHRGARNAAVNPRVPLNEPPQPSGVCDLNLEARRTLLAACSANHQQGGVAGGLVDSAVPPETEVSDWLDALLVCESFCCGSSS